MQSTGVFTTGAIAVLPGATIPYTATVKNELDNRWAFGLFEQEYPLDRNRTIKTMILEPLNEVTMSGAITVPANITQTQVSALGLRAGAVIKDKSTHRHLWLHMNDTNWQGAFDDDSGNDNHVTCSLGNCPRSAGICLTGFDGEHTMRATLKKFNLASSFTVGMWLNPTNDLDFDHFSFLQVRRLAVLPI